MHYILYYSETSEAVSTTWSGWVSLMHRAIHNNQFSKKNRIEHISSIMDLYNEITVENRSGNQINTLREVNAAVIKLENYSQQFEGYVSSLRKFHESGRSADAETNSVNKHHCKNFDIVRNIYSCSSTIGQIAYLLNSDNEPFLIDEDLDRTLRGRSGHEHFVLMFCIASNFLVAMYVELYDNQEVYFSQAALQDETRGLGIKIRNRVEECARKLHDSRKELQNIWPIQEMNDLYNLRKPIIERKDQQSNWENKQYIIRW